MPVSPEARVIMHHCTALLRTLPGATEEKVQAVTTYLGIVIDQAEKEESCPDNRSQASWLP